jgi:hypothetical protein
VKPPCAPGGFRTHLGRYRLPIYYRSRHGAIICGGPTLLQMV